MKNVITNKSHLNRLKDGRGQGRGENYKPFIQANDNKVASQGWLTRTLGWKTNRIHHTLSKFEYQYLLVQEWADRVLDIREQYPLTPIELTQEIALKMNIAHPHLNGEHVIMTTDFMLTILDHQGQMQEVSRTFKPTNKLTKRTLELFEIERRYFQEIGLSWKVVFDIGRPIGLIKNIDWLYDAKHTDVRPGIDKEMIELIAEPIFISIQNLGTTLSISKACLKTDHKIGLEPGTSMFIVKHMLANKRWTTDMNQTIRESAPLKIEI
ncbi:hypothetical protein J2T18_004210 [Paenibacillus polymyxa]|uniref:TnsA endonuclease C-terminal domain-containing protein n=1 Tax=Paenibacillus polymyxa TaxID=1406 RepID=UPI0027915B74|nr:TnsA endonuclease N-terminal domain-containing protein [Paenibacillus polymyxa]MDQ0049888.1 hypothetical protein [Paenibacillus polymyxa]